MFGGGKTDVQWWWEDNKMDVRHVAGLSVPNRDGGGVPAHR